MKIQNTFGFEKGELTFIIYDKINTVKVFLYEAEVELTVEEFYKFISFLEKIKPVKL